MDPKVSPHVAGFETALLDWTDNRFITRDEIRTVAMFLVHLVNLADQKGWALRGWSWKASEYLGVLVVKATVDGTPQVVFTNAKTPISSMRIFLRKLEGDFLEWVPDRFG